MNDILSKIDDLPLQKVLDYARRFGEHHITLAMHAALPLGLTPEIVHLIRINFVPDSPWIAEADLLLSPLCSEVGGELFEMDKEVRGILLTDLKGDDDFGPGRIREIAELLSAYVEREKNRHSYGDMKEFILAQQLVAQAYMNPREAAIAIAEKLKTVSSQASEELSTLETIKIARLADELTGPLYSEEKVLLYSAVIQETIAGNVKEAHSLCDMLDWKDNSIRIGHVTLEKPELLPLPPTEPETPGPGESIEKKPTIIPDSLDIDIFISYAQWDDIPLMKGGEGWISRFHYSLNTRLAQLMGREPIIWRDAKLKGNDEFDEEIKSKLQKAKILLVVISPRYLKSQWCMKELREFLKAAEKSGGVYVGNRSRIFKIVKTYVPYEEHPDEIRSLLGYDFFRLDGENRPHEFILEKGSPHYNEFLQKLDNVAWDINKFLEEAHSLSDMMDSNDNSIEIDHVTLEKPELQPLPPTEPKTPGPAETVKEATSRIPYNFKYDIFISYAHMDNVPLAEGENGWVSNFHRALEVRLGQLLGEKVNIWRDAKLDGNDFFGDEIVEKLSNTAILIAVVSPTYINSQWCLKELEVFRETAEQGFGLRHGNKSRIFKVTKNHVPNEAQPPGLIDIIGYEFFLTDPYTHRIYELAPGTGGENEVIYWDTLDDLAHDIRSFIEELWQPEGKQVKPGATAQFGNPFPGLRPFNSEESHLFFGRDSQTDALTERLSKNRFLTVSGPSGSGKSSLVRAGLIPLLLDGFMPQTGSKWQIALMRPGDNPIGNLADALSQSGRFEYDEKRLGESREIIESTLRRSPGGLVEVASQAAGKENGNLLIIVDQFEELLRSRYIADNSEDESAAFVKLLLEAVQQKEIPVYIILTLRSEFLGDLTKFRGLPEAVNEGQFLIPRMNRDELRAVITGPISVAGAEISPSLVNRLLNDIGDNPDQLPILQHTMMRTWDYWASNRKESEPLDISHYEAVGTMERALSRHAEEAYAELRTKTSLVICEKMFKLLTGRGEKGFVIRRPAKVSEICSVTGASEKEVIDVINVFRKPGGTFLMPPIEEALKPDSVIDISHESLIRIWTRLQRWLQEESNSAELYLRLATIASLYQEGKASLWRDPELMLALKWRDENKPNKAWAQRYDPGFEAAMDFLEKSEALQKSEIAAKKKSKKKSWFKK